MKHLLPKNQKKRMFNMKFMILQFLFDYTKNRLTDMIGYRVDILASKSRLCG